MSGNLLNFKPPARAERRSRVWASALREGKSRCPIELRRKLIKIGAKVVNHGRYVIFQMAEVNYGRSTS
jgi:hypothetical protein